MLTEIKKKLNATFQHSTKVKLIKYCLFFRSAAGLFTVVVGTNQLNSGGARHSVAQLITHPGYNANTIENDIAILRLVTPIEFNSLVQPIALPEVNTGADEQAIVAGWGTLQNGGSLPNQLQFLNLRTLDTADCRSRVNPNPVYESQVCTFTQNGQGACHGDSGGPLVVGNRLVGLVSWGIPCGIGYPDVFTRVFSFTDFITANSDL